MSQVLATTLIAPVLPPSVTALQQQLQSSPYRSLRQLICQLEQGRIVLHGTVPCYYQKQVAQSLAARTVGVELVRNDIEVQPASPAATRLGSLID